MFAEVAGGRVIIINKTCEHCGEQFTRNIYPSQDKPNHYRFCSRSCSRLGTPASEEAKKNMAASGAVRWARDGEKEQQSERLAQFLADPINLAARVVQINRNWASPETHLRASESAKQPHARLARQEGRRRCSDNPVWSAAYSKMMSDRMLQPATKKKCSDSCKAWWAGLSKEQREEKLQSMFDGRLPYMQEQRTSIEVAVELTLIDLGLVFIPQHPVDRCVLDFYLPDLDMVIECDGDYWHSLPGAKRRDQKRDYWLQSKGFIVVRITETDIKADCHRAVLDALATRNRVVAVRAARKSEVSA